MSITPDLETFIRDYKALAKKRPILIHLTCQQAWDIMSQLQLAFRHPKNDGGSRSVAEAFARDLEACATPTPMLKEIARRGWLREYDVPQED